MYSPCIFRIMSTVLCSGNIFSLTPDIFNTLNIKRRRAPRRNSPKGPYSIVLRYSEFINHIIKCLVIAHIADLKVIVYTNSNHSKK